RTRGTPGSGRHRGSGTIDVGRARPHGRRQSGSKSTAPAAPATPEPPAAGPDRAGTDRPAPRGRAGRRKSPSVGPRRKMGNVHCVHSAASAHAPNCVGRFYLVGQEERSITSDSGGPGGGRQYLADDGTGLGRGVFDVPARTADQQGLASPLRRSK